jgi:hypothetical protein
MLEHGLYIAIRVIQNTKEIRVYEHTYYLEVDVPCFLLVLCYDNTFTSMSATLKSVVGDVGDDRPYTHCIINTVNFISRVLITDNESNALTV